MSPLAKHTLGLTILLAFVGGCATSSSTPAMTPLEIQSMQTRTYESDTNTVFHSVVSVFQDLGYTIKNADSQAGFIQADGAADANEALKFWFGSTSTKQTKATGFVEKIGDKVSVRLSFVATVEKSTAYGADDREEKPILNADIYQNAFERIENAIFIRQATN